MRHSPFMTASSGLQIKAEGEFVDTGIALFESEDLINELFSIFITLCCNGHLDNHRGANASLTVDDGGLMYLKGLWLPCVPRVALAGQIDVRNDGLIDFACIPIGSGKEPFSFVTARKLESLPRPWIGIPGARAHYSVRSFYEGVLDRHDKRLNARAGVGLPLRSDGWMYSIVGDKLFPLKCGDWPNHGPALLCARFGGAALQIAADFRHLWTVETSECLIGNTRTPVRLGVTSEMVSSLFYARQAPVTESGRKRPILHWVRQHLRRIEAGISVDVSKHLRGITEFEMEGLPFKITQPIKQKMAA